MEYTPQGISPHKVIHQDGGLDEISLAGLDGEPSTLTTHKAAVTGVHSFDKSCRVTHSVAQVIPTATSVILSFDSERYDTDTEHDPTKKTGTASATLANHLVDTTANQFVAGDVGRLVWNSTDNTFAVITVYNSVSDVTISANIMVSGEAYSISFNSRLTAKTAGKRIITAIISFDANATGIRVVRIKLNGATQIGMFYAGASPTGQTSFCVTSHWNMAVDEYVQVEVYQSSGGNLDVSADSAYGCEFMMARIP